MATTPNMNLDLPVVNTTPGPTWASSVNDAFDVIDSHDHSSGNGVKVTPTGLNINADLPFAGNNATQLRSVRFTDQGTVQTESTDLGCLQLVGGDLWWVNGNGTGVQITSGAGLSFASLGTIGGDFGQPGVTASVTYSDTTKIYSFLQDSGITAGIYSSKLVLADASSGALAVTLTADASTGAYELTWPTTAPTNDTVLTFTSTGVGTFRTISGTSGEVTVTPTSSAHTVSLPSTITKNLTFSGTVNFTGGGRGIVPIGTILATYPWLGGTYSCTATTVPDANGFVVCGGQTLDAGTPLGTAVIPNLNAGAFLYGGTSSGVGGAATVTLAESNMPTHTHSVVNATVPSAAHTHTMAHIHQAMYGSFSLGLYAMTNATTALSTLSFTTATSGAGEIAFKNAAYASGANAALTTLGNYTGYTGGARDAAGSAAVSGTPSATQTISLGNTGSSSAFSILPPYFTVRYVMRVI